MIVIASIIFVEN